MNRTFKESALQNGDALRAFVAAAAPRPLFRRILMVDPAHFQVLHVINPHMEGQLGAVDVDQARQEWESIRTTYEKLGFPVTVVAGRDDFPDLVFVANQLLPFADADGNASIVLSHMAKTERQGEVPFLADSLRDVVHQQHALRTRPPLEGTGDGIWHPGRNLLWGGHGFRTDISAWEEVAELTGASVIPLTLIDERMYHLDVALMPVSETVAFSFRHAFDEESWARLQAGFTTLIEVPEREATTGFALNGHSPDGMNLLLPAGNPWTRQKAIELGFVVHELPTFEFQKSGGSIFCLKNVLP